jgi:hypothetical protein
MTSLGNCSKRDVDMLAEMSRTELVRIFRNNEGRTEKEFDQGDVFEYVVVGFDEKRTVTLLTLSSRGSCLSWQPTSKWEDWRPLVIAGLFQPIASPHLERNFLDNLNRALTFAPNRERAIGALRRSSLMGMCGDAEAQRTIYSGMAYSGTKIDSYDSYMIDEFQQIEEPPAPVIPVGYGEW